MTKEITFEIPLKAINKKYQKHIKNNARLQIFFGGASSGKSVFVIGQRTVIDLLNGGRNFLICRQYANTLRDSAFNEIKKIITQWGLDDRFTINKTRMEITCDNGYQALFKGLDDVQSIKSTTPSKGILTDIIIEEATQIQSKDLKELRKRLRGLDLSQKEVLPKRIVLVFNPILKSHWIYMDYFSAIGWADDQEFYQGKGITIQHSTYKDNAFLAPDDIEDLENEEDEYTYAVYTLGQWGTLGNAIFKPLHLTKNHKAGWEYKDISDLIPTFDNERHGLDFGYSDDPAAYVRGHWSKKKNTLYIFEEYQQTGLSDEALGNIIRDSVGADTLRCDSAEPKSIDALKDSGIRAVGAKKGKDSVRYGIKWMQSIIVVIHTACPKTKAEIESYQWKVSRKTGMNMGEPVEGFDHSIDATRYAMVDDMTKKKKAGFVKLKGR